MPELPEVETCVRGIKSVFTHQIIQDIIIRRPKLRWPIPNIQDHLKGKQIQRIYRRAKYLIFEFSHGNLLIHLGMSGRLCVLKDSIPPNKHDHVDFVLTNGKVLRFTDPRRFGAILWTDEKIETHPLIATIGPEPLTRSFNKTYLWQITRKKKIAIKTLLMDNKMVAGIGNIYATEALFAAGIHPKKSVEKLNLKECAALVSAIKKILQQAIKKGGTTLKDYAQSDGSPGYFSMKLQVYGRAKEKCFKCATTLKSVKMGQRSTVYCPKCQI